MTDEVQEGAPVVEEELEEELATPEVSETEEEVQQPSVAESGLNEERLQELLDARFEALQEQLERQAQSVKDRRFAKIETRLDEALAVKEQVEQAGGWEQYLSQAQQAQSIEDRVEELLEARLSQLPAGQAGPSQKEAWTAEWSAESQKILDAAEQLGITLSTEEYNAAFLGRKFASKGDAYAALNQAILAKAKGESVPAAAVSTEGGEVAQPPEPKTPKTFREQLNESATPDEREAAIAARYKELEEGIRREKLREQVESQGYRLEDLS